MKKPRQLRIISFHILLIAITTLIGCEQTEKWKEPQKPTRSELVSEINSTCFVYANAGSPSSGTKALQDFSGFAHLEESGLGIANDLQMKENIYKFNDSANAWRGLGSSRSDKEKRKEATCISKLRELAFAAADCTLKVGDTSVPDCWE